MFKKKMMFGLLLLVFAGSLFANGVVGKNENSRVKETYEEKFMKRLKSSEKYEAPLLEKVFPGVEFFIQRSAIGKPNRIRLVGNYENKFYPMPAQFNILYKLIEKKSKASIEERIEILTRLIIVEKSRSEYRNSGMLKEIGFINVTKDTSYVDIARFNYKVEMIIDGDNRIAYFWIDKDQIRRIRFENESGTLHLIKPKFVASFRDIEVNITNIYPEIFENDDTEHYYVAVSMGIGESSDNVVEFYISGLPTEPNANPRLQIKPIYGFADNLFLDEPLEVNGSGIAIPDPWSPPNDYHTGICEIIIKLYDVAENIIEGKYLTPEHTLTDNFDGGYDFTVYYTNQFFYEHPNGMSYASTFAGQTKDALVESWNKEINNWDLCQGLTPPYLYDEDENYQVFINDAIDVTGNKYHNSSSTGYLFDFGQMIALGSRIHQRNDGNGNLTTYELEQDLIYSAICHEFYHGIQNELMGGYTDVNNWMEEGQARFIQTVFMDQGTNSNEEFKIGRMYHKDANDYLQGQLDNSLSNLTYGYSLFWRFLFDNYSTSVQISDKMNII